MMKITTNDPETRSPDIVAENLSALKALFPELVAEKPNGVSVNVDVLKALVGDQTVTDADEKYGLNWPSRPRTGRSDPAPRRAWTGTRRRRLDDFKRNPQEFIDLAVEAVNRCKRLAIVDGIKHQRLGDAQYYAQELFEQEELTGYLKNLLDVGKSVYEQVIYDSDTEAAFADQLEKNTAIKVYAKLPGWFTVPTPLGGYNPDWAVLVEEKGQERLYFVVETKGTMLFADALRPTEQAKIDCAREHFEALGTRAAFTVANTFKTFAERYTSALADKKPIESESQNRLHPGQS